MLFRAVMESAISHSKVNLVINLHVWLNMVTSATSVRLTDLSHADDDVHISVQFMCLSNAIPTTIMLSVT